MDLLVDTRGKSKCQTEEGDLQVMAGLWDFRGKGSVTQVVTEKRPMLKKFLQILACLLAQEGKAEPVHGVFRVGGELQTSTESIVRRWEEYIEDLLNPNNTHYDGEAEVEGFGLGSIVTGVKVAAAVK